MENDSLENANSQPHPESRRLVKPLLGGFEREKTTAILEACRSHDLDALISLATSKSGLLGDEVRRTACTCCRLAFGNDGKLMCNS